MVAVKAGNYTLVVADAIGLWVARIECLCSVNFQHYYLISPHCHLGIVVVIHTAHLLEQYSLSSVQISLSALYASNRLVVIKISIQLVILNEPEYS
jgi:hypothetical protein